MAPHLVYLGNPMGESQETLETLFDIENDWACPPGTAVGRSHGPDIASVAG
jgi:hypothetical protein